MDRRLFLRSLGVATGRARPGPGRGVDRFTGSLEMAPRMAEGGPVGVVDPQDQIQGLTEALRAQNLG